MYRRRLQLPRLGLRRAVAGACLGAAVLAVLAFGCREELASDLDRNRPPDTYLTGAPAESSTAFYRLRLNWHGSDVDGKVVGYEYAITDSFPQDEDSVAYAYTTRTDSVFVFSVSENQQVLGHRFYVRAIDNEGAVDPQPAWTFFSVVDLVAPTPIITLAEAWEPGTTNTQLLRSQSDVRPDTIAAGWNVRFRWSGVDGDRVLEEWGELVTVGRVVAYEWQLVGRDIRTYRGGPGDTMIAYTDLRDQKYRFLLRAVDDAGFAALDPVNRTFVWNKDPVTSFTTGVSPAGDTLAHFYASSAVWPEREFFAGDTIPLLRDQILRLVDIRAVVRGYDPDPITSQELTGFQYRTGAGLWQPMADSVIVLTSRGTGDLVLQARARDGLGRRDGTPPGLPIFINHAPRLVDTLGYVGGAPILQQPRRHPMQEFPLDTIQAWGGQLRVQVRAIDPDSTAAELAYQFRAGGFLFEPDARPVLPGPGGIAYYGRTAGQLRLPADWLRPGEYSLDVKVREVGTGDESPRSRVIAIPFRIVE